MVLCNLRQVAYIRRANVPCGHCVHNSGAIFGNQCREYVHLLSVEENNPHEEEAHFVQEFAKTTHVHEFANNALFDYVVRVVSRPE